MKKGYNSILTKSMFEWTKVGVSGILMSLICIAVGIWQLTNSNSGPTEEFSWSDKPWTIMMIVCSLIFIPAYILIANRQSVRSIIVGVNENKLTDFLVPKIHGYINTLTEEQPDWINNFSGGKFLSECTKIMERDSDLNKVQCTVLRYGLKKIKLKKADFEGGVEYQLPHMVVTKIEEKIQQEKIPQLTPFFVLLFLQIIILILSLIVS